MRYCIIDANHLAARSFHAINDLSRKDGVFSGVVYGVIQSLSYIRKETKVQFDNMIAVWDGGSAKWRLQMYPEYKGDRKWRKEDLPQQEVISRDSYYYQLSVLEKNLKNLGIRQARISGVEADDLVAFYSGWYERNNFPCIIATGDRGLHQCASDMVSILDPEKGLLDKEAVEALWKLPINQILLYKAMVGGKDNIKGVKGIGDVRARKLLEIGLCDEGQLDKNTKRLHDMLIQEKDVFTRNVTLMKASKEFSNTMYPEHVRDEALKHLFDKPTCNSLEFLRFLREWELNKFLEEIGRFL